ncbi:MAG TPA: DNA polymerase III subunit chi [Rheinheimera sp.]|uniref:DNA polymerase III subunit chi n=1 Tax=Rheinheimera sp. TaxID=1869214 RepID=UPI000EC5794E|nr:DNA polymerase III subunit chi [Rheinheimera sp.]HCU67594.1 DNA polymerase III subunit chi [Rheinheimera sp.]
MQVQFYLPKAADPSEASADRSEVLGDSREAKGNNQLLLACQLCAAMYRQNLKVFVYCANQQDAEQVDEVLWQFDAHSFVPHNLVGEGPARGAPVEISWLPPKNNRQVLINLTAAVPAFANRFSQIIEFVPAAESDKDIARQKYKHYRQLGVTPQTVQAS